MGLRRDARAPPDAVHLLRFDRAEFPTKRSVRSWLPLNGFPTSNIIETPEKWVVRCDALTDPSVQYAPGVEVVGVPAGMAGKITLAFSGTNVPHPAATGPSNHTPEMPDFESIYAQPEAQARQAQEAEQSEGRRRSTWLDLNFNGMHGNPGPDKPELRYINGKTSTADIAITQPRLMLPARELKANQDRVKRGFIMGYDLTRTGKKR